MSVDSSPLPRAGQHLVSSVAQLEALYGEPSPRALAKEVNRVIAPYRAFIAQSPFVLVASGGPEGLDCSPRGDAPGFVRVVDERTLQLPDRRGNNRMDTLRNLVVDPRIALLFLVPGVGETLRVFGTARIDADPDLCASFAVNGKVPRTVIEVSVGSVYFQCQKALVRSKLWHPESQVPRSRVPSAGEMLKAVCDETFDASAYDRDYPGYMKNTIY